MKKEVIYLEIKGAQGGKDAKLLVDKMVNIYTKTARNNKFN